MTQYSSDLLLKRQSNPFLIAPAPSSTELDIIFQAAMTVPDHAALSPYQFTVCQNEGLDRLTEIFTQAALQSNADEAKLAKVKKMAYRAPMIIVISSKVQLHDKVPKQEQIVTAGCAAYAMQMAAFAQGFGAMWRTGDLSYDSHVKQALNIAEQDEIIGFLYIGSIAKELADKPRKSAEAFITYL